MAVDSDKTRRINKSDPQRPSSGLGTCIIRVHESFPPWVSSTEKSPESPGIYSGREVVFRAGDKT